MDASRVADLVNEVFKEALSVGATDVRVRVRMGDGSCVVFCVDDRWQYRDWIQTPDGRCVDEEVRAGE